MDAMLDEVGPEVIDEWIAYRIVEPPWEQRMMAILKIGFAVLARSWGAKVEPDDFDPAAADRQPAEVSPNQAAGMFRAALGGR